MICVRRSVLQHNNCIKTLKNCVKTDSIHDLLHFRNTRIILQRRILHQFFSNPLTVKRIPPERQAEDDQEHRVEPLGRKYSAVT
jgi:hypothetical protein